MPEHRVCDSCTEVAPVEPVVFDQHIGAFVVRFHSQRGGDFCLACTHKHFWQTTLITFFFGWWGIISFFVTIYCLIRNVVSYCRALGCHRDAATRPQVHSEYMPPPAPAVQVPAPPPGVQVPSPSDQE